MPEDSGVASMKEPLVLGAKVVVEGNVFFRIMYGRPDGNCWVGVARPVPQTWSRLCEIGEPREYQG